MITTLLTSLREHAQHNNVPVIDDPTRQIIEDLLDELKPNTCLEIGSAIGYSTICIAQKIQSWGWRITSFECSFPSYMKAIDAIKDSRLSNIVLYKGKFLKFRSSILPQEIDFLFIDAKKVEYVDYYITCKPLLSPSAVVVFDDVIRYQKKIEWLFDYLEVQWADFEIIQNTEDDWILVIRKGG